MLTELIASVVSRRAALWLVVAVVLALFERTALILVAERLNSAGVIGATVAAVIIGIVAFVRGAVRIPATMDVRSTVYQRVFSALLKRPWVRAEEQTRDRLDLAVYEGADSLEWVTTVAVPALISDIIAIVLLFILVLPQLSTDLVLVGGSILAIGATLAVIARRFAEKAASNNWAAYTPVADMLELCIRGQADIVGNGLSERTVVDGKAKTRHWAKIAAISEALSAFAGRFPVLAAFAAVMMAIVFLRIQQGKDIMSAVGEAMLVGSVFPPLGSLGYHGVEVARCQPRLRALRSLLDYLNDTRKKAGEGGEQRDFLDMGEIRFEGVHYRFARTELEGKTVSNRGLQDINLVWPQGKILLLTGPNGSGKSTLLRLLLGTIEPDRGCIRIGNKTKTDFSEQSWSNHVAYLSQRPYFGENVLVGDALRFFSPNVTDSQMASALDEVGLLQRLNERTNNNPLTVRIETLSSGERQRLALARILLLDRAILILDEPEANLDVAGEQMLFELLQRLSGRMWIAVAAHGALLQKLDCVHIVLPER